MSSPVSLSNLIQYIVFEIQDRDWILYRTRLVKVLYLCDVEYYRSARKRLTTLIWKRYKFGPYAFELNQITSRIGISLGEEQVDFNTGRGIRYTAIEPPNSEKWLTHHAKALVDRVINRWGNEDLNDLLDYVYCYTEPMINAIYLEELDFSKIKVGLRYSVSDTLELPDNAKKEIRELLENQGLISKGFIEEKIDTETAQALNSIEEHKELGELKGQVRSQLGRDQNMIGGRE